jgi:DNA-binding transcriptional LysR family regulator
VEFRQLRYFVTLAEELHFGRAAAREHIVQSALSQQIQRLERELGIALVERSTHHVRLTAAGDVLLTEARDILGHVEHAAAAARAAATANTMIRIAVGDACFDSMPRILAAVRDNDPRLEIHQIEAPIPEQCRLLAERSLDVGFGLATHAPVSVASEVVRLDPFGVLIADGHRFSQRESVPLRLLAGEPLLFAAEERGPECNQFIRELCRTAGFSPTIYPGTVQSLRAGVELIRELRCLICVPRSCDLMVPAVRWLPLVDPSTYYPWSLLWRAEDRTELTRSVLRCGRALSRRLGWLKPPSERSARPIAATR